MKINIKSFGDIYVLLHFDILELRRQHAFADFSWKQVFAWGIWQNLPGGKEQSQKSTWLHQHKKIFNICTVSCPDWWIWIQRAKWQSIVLQSQWLQNQTIERWWGIGHTFKHTFYLKLFFLFILFLNDIFDFCFNS